MGIGWLFQIKERHSMKRLSILILAFSLLLGGCGRGDRRAAENKAPSGAFGTPAVSAAPAPTPTPTPAPTPTPKPMSDQVKALLPRNDEVWAEKPRREFMEGRLLIPSVGIDVALILWGEGKSDEEVRQGVTDAEDSALLYFDGYGNVIADHKTQDFATLTSVQPGDAAYILTGDSIYTLRCDLVTDGINTGSGITDADGKIVTARETFTCYTCMEDWTNIRIVGFRLMDMDVVEQPLMTFSYPLPPVEDMPVIEMPG